MYRIAITTTALAAALAVLPIAPATAASDAVYLGGTGTGTGLPALLGTGGDGSAFARAFVPDLDQRTDVIYNGSPVANPHDAVPAALAAIQATDDPAVVIGLSKGSQVARAAEQQDTRTDTRYVLVGDPDDDHGISRTFGLSAPKQEFTHDVEIVVAEYDGVGDMPDRPNLLATANALAGWAFVHPNYGTGGDADPLTRLDEAKVTTSKNPNGTTTTRKLIPTRELPLLKPLRDTERTLTRGRDDFTDAIEKPLRDRIDAGYSRNDKPKTTTTTPKSTTTSSTRTTDTGSDTGSGSDAGTSTDD
ncbi:DNA binding protein [Mycobacterium phage Jolie2]|uniref:PE-PPE like protein n=1 Tax=Mycobacterium phage Jolie2 TaxID=1458831 RepID=W8E9K0_9CAUD|nr:DNA binding protein [Mycobacterium phage Jolie2]AHJ86609.1 PE-PPE like protein [Mycobacterium phage Jolie2]